MSANSKKNIDMLDFGAHFETQLPTQQQFIKLHSLFTLTTEKSKVLKVYAVTSSFYYISYTGLFWPVFPSEMC